MRTPGDYYDEKDQTARILRHLKSKVDDLVGQHYSDSELQELPPNKNYLNAASDIKLLLDREIERAEYVGD